MKWNILKSFLKKRKDHEIINSDVKNSEVPEMQNTKKHLNSIEAARQAPLFDVLLFASEEKMLAEAEYLDFLEQQKRKGSK